MSTKRQQVKICILSTLKSLPKTMSQEILSVITDIEGHDGSEYAICGLGSYGVVYCGGVLPRGHLLAFQKEDMQEDMTGMKNRHEKARLRERWIP